MQKDKGEGDAFIKTRTGLANDFYKREFSFCLGSHLSLVYGEDMQDTPSQACVMLSLLLFEDTALFYIFREKKNFDLMSSPVTCVEVLVNTECFCTNKMKLLVGWGFVMTKSTTRRVTFPLNCF